MDNSNAQTILSAFGIWFGLCLTTNGVTLAWIVTNSVVNSKPKALWIVVLLFTVMNILASILCVISLIEMHQLQEHLDKGKGKYSDLFLNYVFYGSASIAGLFVIAWLFLPRAIKAYAVCTPASLPPCP